MNQKDENDISQYFYRASAADFMKIPGCPVAYWASPELINAFSRSEKLDKRAVKGLDTNGNIDRFLRRWYEISVSQFGPFEDRSTWQPISKGGEFRRWYGNNEFCINYKGDGKALKQNKANLRNAHFYFKEGLTWTVVSSGGFAARYMPDGFLFDQGGCGVFLGSDDSHSLFGVLGSLNSKFVKVVSKIVCPTLNFTTGDVRKFPIFGDVRLAENAERCVALSKTDWDSAELSWEFSGLPLLSDKNCRTVKSSYSETRERWAEMTSRMKTLQEENNRIVADACGLSEELESGESLAELSLTCNPQYRYGGNRSSEELETMLQCDTIEELVSYAIGCMMGRYSLDKSGLILASQGETLKDYLDQIPSPSFSPDDDGILPLTDQEWFADDATNRFREFIEVAWGKEHLQENLEFVAESLCLHAIKPPSAKSGGESALDTIRRYLSTQFYKDHMHTYKKRPIYWLFSSGKHKAFECLVYLHRYNEGTLARMRTEYVIPLSAKLNAYVQKLEGDRENSSSAAETKRLEKAIDKLHKQQAELAEFDEKLRHYADQRISLDLDDGVKVNYGKFGDLLAEVKAITGEKPGS